MSAGSAEARAVTWWRLGRALLASKNEPGRGIAAADAFARAIAFAHAAVAADANLRKV